MSMSSELSRRALAAASAAFAIATVTDIAPNDDGTRFDLDIPLAFVHPASGVSGTAELSAGIALAPSTEAERAAIVQNVRVTVSSQLESAGQTVPPDRVAVALL